MMIHSNGRVLACGNTSGIRYAVKGNGENFIILEPSLSWDFVYKGTNKEGN